MSILWVFIVPFAKGRFMDYFIRGHGWQRMLLWGLLAGQAWAADPAPPSAESRRERLKLIRGIVQTLDTALAIRERSEAATLRAEPSLLYADNTRGLTDSSLWIWEHQGQAVGVTAVEWTPRDGGEGLWTFEFASLTPAALKISLPQGNWTMERNVAIARTMPIAPAVAASRAKRQLQMKQLAERFTVIELHRMQGRIELRRLSAPIYRQAEAAPGDGAMFVFANGTNPEVVLMINTIEFKGETVWAYTLGALAAEELVVHLDGREVWRETRFTRPGARPTYLNGRLPSPAEDPAPLK
jgi:hypothetical protein